MKDKKFISGMLPHKTEDNFIRPSFLDVFAQEAVIISKRSACLWFEVGAIIIAENRHNIGSGYNGPVSGDVDPREAGCARVVDGVLIKGGGLCRGSHAELNAIGSLNIPTLGVELSIMVTTHPCKQCAKQIKNKGIKQVYYLWNYGDEDDTVSIWLKERGVSIKRYTSPFLESWIELNKYKPLNVE
ncbi:MAG: dCMP deaminase [Candidatus Paceibacteria bacterium]|jgi:dCMP deaminase